MRSLMRLISFAQPRRSLGYREAEVLGDGPLGPAGTLFRGHEFHYADTAPGASGERLFRSAATGVDNTPPDVPNLDQTR